MKNIILLFAMLLIGGVAMCQQTTKVAKDTKVVKVDTKTFKTDSSKTNSSYQPTGYYYQLKSGEKREIYIHTVTRGDNKGKTFCYIKTPKGSWSKINVKPEELH